MKYRYYRAGHIRTLKEGVDTTEYERNHPDAIKINRVPCEKTLERWMNDGGCKALDGCWTEPDAACEHGIPSWLMALGMI